MPLYKIITPSAATQILVWKITESLEELLPQVALNESNVLRFNGMKSELHRRAFLSVRMLLTQKGYTDFDLYYDEFGKPHLKDGKHISISHSHEFSTIVISNQNIGIDLELQREKIVTIAHKFVAAEFSFLKQDFLQDYIQKLTVIWGAKEAIFKIRNELGISFKDHIEVKSFEIKESRTKAILHFGNLQTLYEIYFEELENFSLVYAFESNLPK